MKKILSVVLIIVAILNITACQNGSMIKIGNKNYESNIAGSGYYLDAATLSDIALGEALSKVVEIKKPENLGKVELPNFADIELKTAPKEEITENMIEAELERERDIETVYSPIKVKRAARMSDKVIIDFKGYIDGEELAGGAGEDTELVLGSNMFIPGFEEKLVGHMAGKKFSIFVTFPEDYQATEIAGKEAMFEVTIKSIEEAETPEIDEEFVKRHSKNNAKTVEEYREEVKKRIENRNEFMNNQSLIYQLTEKLFEEAKFEPTTEALAWQFSAMIAEYNAEAERNGVNIYTMATANGQSIKDFYDNLKSQTPQVVEMAMLIDELKKMFKIQITEQDVRNWFDNLADISGYGSQVTYEDYIAMAGYDNIKNIVEQEKLLLEAVPKCKLVEEVSE